MRWCAMALEPILWALHDSPVNSTTDRMLLAGLAEKADADGTNAFPSRRTLARIALCDVKTVQRRLAFLAERGVITLGDQQAARYIPAHSRPKVYDLQIPAAWYGPERLARVNEDRAHRGLPPLTQQTRPALPPAPPRTERSDKGKPRRSGGDSQSPPPQHPESDRRGDWQSRGSGDSQSLQGGLTVPQPSPITLPLKKPRQRLRRVAPMTPAGLLQVVARGRPAAAPRPQALARPPRQPNLGRRPASGGRRDRLTRSGQWKRDGRESWPLCCRPTVRPCCARRSFKPWKEDGHLSSWSSGSSADGGPTATPAPWPKESCPPPSGSP